MAQLIDFMLNDENRKEFLNETTNEALATRLRAEDAQVERARSELMRQRAGVWVVDTFAAHRDAACGDAVDGNVFIAATSLAVFILLIPVTTVAFMGEKRFSVEDGDVYF